MNIENKQLTEILTPRRIELYQKFQMGSVGLALAVFCYTLFGYTKTLNLFDYLLFDVSFGFGLRIDALSSTLFLMIAVLGAVLGSYSKRYLYGEQRQGYFYNYLALCTLSVSLLVLSSNLVMFFLMWMASSFSLHQLLVFYSERSQAKNAALKKFIVSRIGDLAIMLGIVLTYKAFNTFEFTELFRISEQIAPGSDQEKTLGVVGLLFVLGAMTKSVQFPFHFWLPETMETPAPVSALMHAGIINAGGFLMIRLSPILQHATTAHALLAIVGALTAVFGGLVMMTQSDIKKKLAYSTISQMGMMMFACGLGAFVIVLFHILAHSFYKAYAFLSTGMQVAEAKKAPHHVVRSSSIYDLSMVLLGLAVVSFGIAYYQSHFLSYFTYGAILFLGLAQGYSSLNRSKMKLKSFFQLKVVLLAFIGFFILLEYALGRFTSGLFPMINAYENGDLIHEAICLGAYAVFSVGFVLSGRLRRPSTPFMKQVYAYLLNGGYFTPITNNALQGLDLSSSQTKGISNSIYTGEHANA